MERDDLVTDEGVDEGSAAAAQDGPATAPVAARVVGSAPVGRPDSEEQPAPPAGDVGADGDGQQLALGEG